MVGVGDGAAGSVPLGVLGVAGVADLDVAVGVGARGGEVHLGALGDDIAAAGGEVTDVGEGDGVLGARGLEGGGDADGGRGKDGDLGDGEVAGDGVVGGIAGRGVGDGLGE